MKKVSKKMFDLAIENCRKYWELPLNDCVKFGDEWQIICMDIGNETNSSWSAWKDLLSSVLSSSGLKPFATNEQIYEILKILGWEVFDE